MEGLEEEFAAMGGQDDERAPFQVPVNERVQTWMKN